MKFFKIIYLICPRIMKLILYFFVTFPFFVVRLFFFNKGFSPISIFHKAFIVIIGEIWIFGKNKIDMREVYETQRLNISDSFTIKKLIYYIPGQWFTQSPLETSLLLLMRPKKLLIRHKVSLIPYVLYLMFFDESRHHVKANHGIASALALSSIFKKLPGLSKYYYLQALKILRKNSNYFFYDEGSTNYHIFVTSLYKNYFFLMENTPIWFKGYQSISDLLVACKAEFYFGDDDKSAWLYNYRLEATQPTKITISSLIKNKNFKKSVLDKYFKIFMRDNVILLICINGSKWGHAHYMVGSFLYYINDSLCIGYNKNSTYTFDRDSRQNDRLFTCNSPVDYESLSNVNLAFFKKIPKNFRTIKSIVCSNNIISIMGNTWRREIDFRSQRLCIIDYSAQDVCLLSSLSEINDTNYLQYDNRML